MLLKKMKESKTRSPDIIIQHKFLGRMADSPSASNKQHADLRPYQRQILDDEKVTKFYKNEILTMEPWITESPLITYEKRLCNLVPDFFFFFFVFSRYWPICPFSSKLVPLSLYLEDE